MINLISRHQKRLFEEYKLNLHREWFTQFQSVYMNKNTFDCATKIDHEFKLFLSLTIFFVSFPFAERTTKRVRWRIHFLMLLLMVRYESGIYSNRSEFRSIFQLCDFWFFVFWNMNLLSFSQESSTSETHSWKFQFWTSTYLNALIFFRKRSLG